MIIIIYMTSFIGVAITSAHYETKRQKKKLKKR